MLQKAYVLRTAKNEFGAFGILFDGNGVPFAVTLENEETLIPEGIYDCKRSKYHGGGYPTFEIIVDGRTRILFHRLNWDFQSKGCIGVAESYELINGIPAIAQSGKGFEEFWEKYRDFDTFKLEVHEWLWPFNKD